MIVFLPERRFHIGLHLRVRAAPNQKLDHACIGHRDRSMQSAPAKRKSIDIGAVIQQKVHHLWRPKTHRLVQRTRAPIADHWSGILVHNLKWQGWSRTWPGI